MSVWKSLEAGEPLKPSTMAVKVGQVVSVWRSLEAGEPLKPSMMGVKVDQGAGGGVRTPGRRIPADIRADSLATVPPTRDGWLRTSSTSVV
ncbi:hypothetical protein PoB_005211300 [Plakobranchus ocellatus]|uniref:Uncharacterized protein n=1 Tax=Plakobranchus ocellatus TaxID=259542 RepID=A0AAV4C2G1_9GAST|nr:hypothetical protein PoB_005211300 [Plakobranchus ocellatus]